MSISRIPLLLVLLLLALPAAVAAEEGARPQPAYHELSPSLVVNLPTGAKYIRCDVQLMTLEPELLAEIQLHAPAIRDTLLMLISEQDGATLKTAEGKEKLRQDALDATRGLMKGLVGKGVIDELFFTAFFVQ
jgi:flagellar FliL protein